MPVPPRGALASSVLCSAALAGAQHHLQPALSLPQGCKAAAAALFYRWGCEEQHPPRTDLQREGGFQFAGWCLARHGSPASSAAILPGYRGGKHSVPSRFFAVRECRYKSSPPSSHRTILAAYLPPTPRNSPDLLHLCWGVGIKWGLRA